MHLLTGTWARGATALLLVAVISWFAGQRLAGDGAVDGAILRDNLPSLGAVLGLMMLSTLLLGVGWIALLESVTSTTSRQRALLLVAFAYAWLGRYIPGTLPFLAGRVALARRAGYRTRPLVLTTAVQNVLEVLVSAIVGACLIIASLGVTERSGLFIALATAPALGLLVLHPRLLRNAANIVLRSVRRDPLPVGDLPPVRALTTSAILVVANQLLNGVALWIVLDVVAGASVRDVMLVVGATSLAGAAGMFVVLVPAGLGVRDGALAALLASRFTMEVAALASVTFRLLAVVADLALFAVALAVDVAAGWRVALGALRGEPTQPAILEPAATPRRVAAVPERRSA